MVAVDRICVAAPICASLSIAPHVSCTALRGFAVHGIRPCHRRHCALFHAPGWPTPREGLYRHQYYWLPILWFRSGLLVLIGVVQTVLAMPPALAGVGASCGMIRSWCRDRSYLRDATESIAKTTKHLHTGHQTTSVNTYSLIVGPRRRNRYLFVCEENPRTKTRRDRSM